MAKYGNLKFNITWFSLDNKKDGWKGETYF